ncbi:hypothetical protein MAR_030939 [Mya arenaria]|uniref:Uncharacterized protein n=1 Tax=Mya arenaria TaxID=6604 RepID=A0ABY7F3L2_MYAAR|nr:uncharacterized protein LOC128205719 isoform X2 [Mya arenaria]WAR16345.1 hypothetical protein MAR_030939 [Mya arenaria]
MGSGSSKEKSPPVHNVQPRRADNVSKGNKPLKNNQSDRNVTQDSKQSVKTDIKKSNINDSRTVQNNVTANGKNNSTFQRKPAENVNSKKQMELGSFESDSEGEDIDAVLEATKNEYNRNQEQRLRNNNNEQVSYPETYAQRLQREQYKHEPRLGLARQKTIYRNPEEWEIQEKEVENFDVSRFKQANVHKAPPVQSDVDDIYSPREPSEPVMYSSSIERQKSLPHYDTSEEMLLAEIEQDF